MPILAAVLTSPAFLAAGQASESASDAKLPRVGINPGATFLRADLENQLRRMRQAGIREVRLEVSPETIARSAIFNSWWLLDSFDGVLRKHGLRWYPLIAHSTANLPELPGNRQQLPQDHDAFAGLVAHFVARYNVPALEIWNEPNSEEFAAGASPEEYADLYAATYWAVKAARPKTRLATAGLANRRGWEGWVKRMFEHLRAWGIRPDAVGFHPYRGDPLTQLRKLRRLMDRAGLRRARIDVTEYGRSEWQTRDPKRRRRYLRDVTRQLMRSNLGIDRVMPFVWLGGEGYSHYDLGPQSSPSGQGLREAIEALGLGTG